MHARFTNWSLALAVCATAALTAAGCGKDNSSPTTPSGGGSSSEAAADGTTLKATAPTTSSPIDRVVVDTLRPTLRIGASQGKYVTGGSGFQYRFELRDEAGNGIAGYLVNGTELTIPDSLEMSYSKVYRWRARAEMNGAFGPWSSTAEFTTPNPPSAAVGGGGAGVGATRNISVQEAAAMIIDIHNRFRVNLGSASSREQRIAFLWMAVAIIHYGHPTYNPAGGDPNWCVKDAGSGRPPSDDVIVLCNSRDAWDLIASAGGDGYSWHLDYVGRLDGNQNVYPPPASSLPR